MFGFLSKDGAQQSTAAKSSRRPVQLGVESLEDRMLMSATLYGNDLVIEGTSKADQVIVRTEGSFVVVKENGVDTGRFNASKVNLLEFYGRSGNDNFRNDTAIRAYAEGGLGDDTLIGGSVTDEFYGGDNNDTLIGRGGVDYLFGQADNDRLDGGKDGVRDELQGGIGADVFVAEKSGRGGFQNRDTPMDFKSQDGDYIYWGDVLIQ